jgi:hypothetical protein
MELKTGTKLRSQVGTAEIIVVKAPAGDVSLTSGGQPMILASETAAEGLTADPAQAEDLLIGKRYTDEAGAIEVLVTKAGVGTVALDGAALAVKQAKTLPASD